MQWPAATFEPAYACILILDELIVNKGVGWQDFAIHLDNPAKSCIKLVVNKLAFFYLNPLKSTNPGSVIVFVSWPKLDFPSKATDVHLTIQLPLPDDYSLIILLRLRAYVQIKRSDLVGFWVSTYSNIAILEKFQHVEIAKFKFKSGFNCLDPLYALLCRFVFVLIFVKAGEFVEYMQNLP